MVGTSHKPRSLAAKALRENPKSAAALEFDGRVKFYRGNIKKRLSPSIKRSPSTPRTSGVRVEAAHATDPGRRQNPQAL